MKQACVILFLMMTSSSVFASLEARKASLARDLYDVLIQESEEVFQEDLANGNVYRDEAVVRYEKVIQNLCTEYSAKTCPRVYFSNKESNQMAANYPNQVLQINKAAAARLTENEMKFILAHEFAHHFFNHSKQRVLRIADVVVENSIIVTEESTTLATAFFYPGILEYHRQAEREADEFAFTHIKKHKLSIECDKLFKKILNGAKVSTDMHDGPDSRCPHPSHP